MDPTSQTLFQYAIYAGLVLLILTILASFGFILWLLAKLKRIVSDTNKLIESTIKKVEDYAPPATVTTGSPGPIMEFTVEEERPGPPSPPPPITLNEGLKKDPPAPLPPPEPKIKCGVCKHPLEEDPIRVDALPEGNFKVYKCSKCNQEVRIPL